MAKKWRELYRTIPPDRRKKIEAAAAAMLREEENGTNGLGKKGA